MTTRHTASVTLVYRVDLEPAEEGGFIITFPDFDWGVTQGDTEADALEMAKDCLEVMVVTMLANSKPLPYPLEMT